MDEKIDIFSIWIFFGGKKYLFFEKWLMSKVSIFSYTRKSELNLDFQVFGDISEIYQVTSEIK